MYSQNFMDSSHTQAWWVIAGSGGGFNRRINQSKSNRRVGREKINAPSVSMLVECCHTKQTRRTCDVVFMADCRIQEMPALSYFLNAIV
jgi:hypothetical protein